MLFWRCSTGILRRPSSAYVSGGGQTQSHFGTIAARSTRRFGTTFPTSVMAIVLRSAAISLFDRPTSKPERPAACPCCAYRKLHPSEIRQVECSELTSECRTLQLFDQGWPQVRLREVLRY